MGHEKELGVSRGRLPDSTQKRKKEKVVGGADDQVRQEMGERVKPIQVNLGCAANHKAFMFRPKILN